MRGVSDLVLSYQEEDRMDILIDYIVWRLVAAYYPDRPQDESTRRERCIKETEDMFAPAVTSMYIRAKGVVKSQDAVDQVREAGLK